MGWSMSAWGMGLGALGGGLSALGGFASASANRTAANEARDLQQHSANQNMLNLGQLVYGPQFGTNYSYANFGGPGGSGGGSGGYGNVGVAGGTNLGGTDKWTIHANYPRDANGNISYSNGSLLGQLSSLADYGANQNAATLSGYNADTARLGGLAQGAEEMARRWGVGRAGIINDDFDRALKNANTQSLASLSSAGFGNSTLGANQIGSNSAQNGRERQRALQDLSESQIDRQLGARTQRLNVEGGRASGRTSLEQNITGQNIGLRRAPIDTALQVQMSPIMNPGANGSLSGYVPTQSGWGNALQSLGAGLSAYGGFNLGQQGGLGNNQLASLQEYLRYGGGAGQIGSSLQGPATP